MHTLLVLHIKNNFEFTFPQILEEDYCLTHHPNKIGYRMLGKLAKVFLVLLAQIALYPFDIYINSD